MELAGGLGVLLLQKGSAWEYYCSGKEVFHVDSAQATFTCGLQALDYPLTSERKKMMIIAGQEGWSGGKCTCQRLHKKPGWWSLCACQCFAFVCVCA